ncbi:MAG: iron-sulfur cluster assembly scaffold protein [Paracoccaceae bacterium]
MPNNTDMIKLYSQRILSLATELPFTSPLTNPDISITKRSPVCGSTISIELKVSDNHISEFSQNVKACALGQATASIVANSIIGISFNEVRTARTQLLNMLTTNGNTPDKPFEELEVLTPAKDYKNRHASIMLPLEAIIEGWQTLN